MLSIAVMHDSRRSMHPLLLERLEGAHVTVVDAPGLTLWQRAQTAWGLHKGDHHIVLHDDIRPCAGFVEHAQAVIQAHPQSPLCFWGSRVEQDMPEAGGFLSYCTFAWGGSLCLPKALIDPFLDYCEAKIDPAWSADDTRFTLWCADTGRRLLVPYPNLVQHGDMKSLSQPDAPPFFSPNYVDDPGPCVAGVWGKPVVDVPGNPLQFLISRSMHYVHRQAH